MAERMLTGANEVVEIGLRLTKQAGMERKAGADESLLWFDDKTPSRMMLKGGDSVSHQVGGAGPYWTKLSVTFAQVQVDGVTKTVALIALPINAWVHALAWKAPADWAPGAGEWEAGTLELVLTLKDEDGAKVFLNEGVLGTISGGAWVPAALEGGAGQVPQRFSSSVAKNLVALFEIRTPA